MAIWDRYKTKINEKWYTRWTETHPPDVAGYSWHYLFTGGKEIRANLFCELWNYLSPDSEITAELAFAIECIHVASIVLDDTPWMDNATKRRGRTTLHIMFSPKKAILIAYELVTIATDIWRNNKPAHVDTAVWQNLLISKLQRLIMGQWFDLEKKGNLLELASLKTGVLFELVAETVATCIQLNTDFWKIWGNNVGILFQWVDDWFDREEDIQQNNRNAFNEAYDTTMHNYIYLWRKIENDIGQQWFTRQFGSFMKKYFVHNIHIDIEPTQITALQNINIPYYHNIRIPELSSTMDTDDIAPAVDWIKTINGKDILKKIFKASEHLFEYPALKENLWYIDENKWESLSELTTLAKSI